MAMWNGALGGFAHAQRFSPRMVQNAAHRSLASSAMRLGRHRAVPRSTRTKERKESWMLERFKCLDFLDLENPTTLILVGGTGSTKSALGNFLLDPSGRHLLKAPTFKVGHTGAPETKAVQVGHGHGVTVVDTPGFNGSHEDNWENMIKCVKDMRSVGTFHVVVLVMKFEDKMSRHWKDTVLYYRRMGKLAENLVIVLNAYRPGSQSLRAAGGDARRANMEGVSKEVQDLLHLPAPPPVFSVDSYLEGERYVKLHLIERREILRHAAQQQPTLLAGLVVPKTECMLRGDELKVEGLAAESAQVSEKLAKSLQRLDNVKAQIAKLALEDHELSAHIDEKKGRIQKLDTEEMVELEGQRVSISEGESWGFRRKIVRFRVSTGTAIRQTQVHHTCSEYCLFCYPNRFYGDFVQRAHRFCWRKRPGFTAEVKVYSWSKDVHEEEIRRGKQEMQRLEETQSNQRQRRMELQAELSQIEASVQELQEALRGIDQKIEHLKRTHLTVEEAESYEASSTP